MFEKTRILAIFMLTSTVYAGDSQCHVYMDAVKKVQKNEQIDDNILMPFEKTILKYLRITPETIQKMKELKKSIPEQEKIGIAIVDTGMGSSNCFIQDNLHFQRNILDIKEEEIKKLNQSRAQGTSIDANEIKKNIKRKRKFSTEDDYVTQPFQTHGGGIACLIKQIYPKAPLFAIRHGTTDQLSFGYDVLLDFLKLQKEDRQNILENNKKSLSIKQANIINMSYGPAETKQEKDLAALKSDQFQEAAEHQAAVWKQLLSENNVLVIAAGEAALPEDQITGRDYSSELKTVAKYYNDALKQLTPKQRSRIIFVGALEGNNAIANFTNYFSQPATEENKLFYSRFIFAPGDNIPSCSENGGIKDQTGTSFSAPIVCATLAYLVNEFGVDLDNAIQMIYSHKSDLSYGYKIQNKMAENYIKTSDEFQKAKAKANDYILKCQQLKKEINDFLTPLKNNFRKDVLKINYDFGFVPETTKNDKEVKERENLLKAVKDSKLIKTDIEITEKDDDLITSENIKMLDIKGLTEENLRKMPFQKKKNYLETIKDYENIKNMKKKYAQEKEKEIEEFFKNIDNNEDFKNLEDLKSKIKLNIKKAMNEEIIFKKGLLDKAIQDTDDRFKRFSAMEVAIPKINFDKVEEIFDKEIKEHSDENIKKNIINEFKKTLNKKERVINFDEIIKKVEEFRKNDNWNDKWIKKGSQTEPENESDIEKTRDNYIEGIRKIADKNNISVDEQRIKDFQEAPFYKEGLQKIPGYSGHTFIENLTRLVCGYVTRRSDANISSDFKAAVKEVIMFDATSKIASKELHS